MTTPRWLEWAREIQALAQTGNQYARDDFQRQRYQRLMEIAAEMISESSDLQQAPILAAFMAQTGYATPKIDVRGAVFQNKKLLLVRERMDDSWTLPGGWADVGDIPSQAAEREVLEEAGYQVKACKVIGVYDANRQGRLEVFHAFKIIFLCNILGGEAKTSLETSDVAFFAKEMIPEKLSGERTRLRHIQDAFACLENPDFTTVFD